MIESESAKESYDIGHATYCLQRIVEGFPLGNVVFEIAGGASELFAWAGVNSRGYVDVTNYGAYQLLDPKMLPLGIGGVDMLSSEAGMVSLEASVCKAYSALQQVLRAVLRNQMEPEDYGLSDTLNLLYNEDVAEHGWDSRSKIDTEQATLVAEQQRPKMQWPTRSCTGIGVSCRLSDISGVPRSGERYAEFFVTGITTHAPTATPRQSLLKVYMPLVGRQKESIVSSAFALYSYYNILQSRSTPAKQILRELNTLLGCRNREIEILDELPALTDCIEKRTDRSPGEDRLLTFMKTFRGVNQYFTFDDRNLHDKMPASKAAEESESGDTQDTDQLQTTLVREHYQDNVDTQCNVECMKSYYDFFAVDAQPPIPGKLQVHYRIHGQGNDSDWICSPINDPCEFPYRWGFQRHTLSIFNCCSDQIIMFDGASDLWIRNPSTINYPRLNSHGGRHIVLLSDEFDPLSRWHITSMLRAKKFIQTRFPQSTARYYFDYQPVNGDLANKTIASQGNMVQFIEMARLLSLTVVVTQERQLMDKARAYALAADHVTEDLVIWFIFSWSTFGDLLRGLGSGEGLDRFYYEMNFRSALDVRFIIDQRRDEQELPSARHLQVQTLGDKKRNRRRSTMVGHDVPQEHDQDYPEVSQDVLLSFIAKVLPLTTRSQVRMWYKRVFYLFPVDD